MVGGWWSVVGGRWSVVGGWWSVFCLVGGLWSVFHLVGGWWPSQWLVVNFHLVNDLLDRWWFSWSVQAVVNGRFFF